MEAGNREGKADYRQQWRISFMEKSSAHVKLDR